MSPEDPPDGVVVEGSTDLGPPWGDPDLRRVGLKSESSGFARAATDGGQVAEADRSTAARWIGRETRITQDTVQGHIRTNGTQDVHQLIPSEQIEVHRGVLLLGSEANVHGPRLQTTPELVIDNPWSLEGRSNDSALGTNEELEPIGFEGLNPRLGARKALLEHFQSLLCRSPNIALGELSLDSNLRNSQ